MVQGLTVWNRDSRIVLGIDVGATQSAVAFCHLYKGSVANVHRVSDWPGQGDHRGEPRIPTQIYYDRFGEAVKVGAETCTDDAMDLAETEGWFLARYFKLHLHPDTMERTHNLATEDLPNGITLMKIYVDFLRYLLEHTKEYFGSHILQGQSEWSRHCPSMDVVIAHPNGWGVNEQDFLRRAAVTAGYATAENAPSQIKFVSEAEASVHFCIFHMDIDSKINPGAVFVVCDAGGATVDTTVYAVKAKTPLQLEEKKASACIQAGGIFVDRAAERYIRGFLTRALVREADINIHVTTGVRQFEKGLKRNFGNDDTSHTITVGERYYNDRPRRVTNGRTPVPRHVVESFFSARVEEIFRSLEDQMSGLNVKDILVVGGFGQSPYLHMAIKRRFETPDRQITAAHDGSSKAVADGTVIWLVKTCVTSRAPRFSFGVNVTMLYGSSDSAHVGRPTFYKADGRCYVAGRWSPIAPRGVVIDANTATRKAYKHQYDEPTPDLSDIRTSIYAWTNPDIESKWLKEPNGEPVHGFRKVCTVQADLSGKAGLLREASGANGNYWILEYTIGIRFGGTELEAFVEWYEGENKFTSNAAVIPNGLE